MRIRGIAVWLAVALCTVLLAGCSAPSSTLQSTASEGNAIKIGIDLPVSGADASTGIPTRNGAVLAVEQANQKPVPGGFKFVAEDLDDAVQGTHDPAQGATNTKTFISDPSVLAMIGPFNSNVAKAEIPLTNDAELVQISASTTNPGLTKGDAAAKLRTSHPDVNSFFRVCATDDRQGTAIAHFARKYGFKRAFVIDDNETYGKGLADVFAAKFEAFGGAVLGHEHLTKGQQDFKALLTKAQSLSPDVVFYGGTTATGGGLLRKQMADAGMANLAYMGGDGIADQEFLTTAGDQANGSYFTVAAPDTSRLPTAKAFIAAYAKRWNSPLGPYSANAYTAASIEIAAIEQAIRADGGKLPSRADVVKYVAATTNFDSPIGKVGFDKNGDTRSPILSFYKVSGGKPQFIDNVKS